MQDIHKGCITIVIGWLEVGGCGHVILLYRVVSHALSAIFREKKFTTNCAQYIYLQYGEQVLYYGNKANFNSEEERLDLLSLE